MAPTNFSQHHHFLQPTHHDGPLRRCWTATRPPSSARIIRYGICCLLWRFYMHALVVSFLEILERYFWSFSFCLAAERFSILFEQVLGVFIVSTTEKRLCIQLLDHTVGVKQTSRKCLAGNVKLAIKGLLLQRGCLLSLWVSRVRMIVSILILLWTTLLPWTTQLGRKRNHEKSFPETLSVTDMSMDPEMLLMLAKTTIYFGKLS